ncbi:O-antigen ligase family protein [Cellulophaga baltica]|uniref:O-antigen ligase family protein n=1 Tax=Cellulophaga TaxID=104264 RepID=UPI001C06F12F|nr:MULTISPECIES: O-antigen ligase family protein [Cellulophaga]MBU2995972.1 O-antigen ligase family protein [Cellulophaga baltica]MDO6767367.1 O-antigen ligase family protein [Cellulophaga sp. 1_MG-2023]
MFVSQAGREYYRFLYTRYTDGGNFEHIYLSLYSFLSGILLYQFKITTIKIRILLGFYLLLHLFMMGSRAIIISIILGGFLFLLVISLKNKKYIKYFFGFILTISLLFSSAYLFKDTLLFNRYSQVFEWYQKRDLILERNYSVNNRLKVYIIGLEACFDSSGGIDGTGLADKKIKDTYDLKFTTKFPFKTSTYNAHNQYINNFIDWGYIGVLVLISLLILIIRNCFKENLLYICFFWICFSILLLMECILYRQRGVFLFVIFLAIFAQTKIINNNITLTNDE